MALIGLPERKGRLHVKLLYPFGALFSIPLKGFFIMAIADKRGKKYGRLTPIRIVGKNKHGSMIWECRCDCGNIVNIGSDALKKNGTKSCGCLNVETRKSGDNRRTHGGCGTRLYRIWKAMRSRCYNPHFKDYKNYQKITICDEWLNDFSAFRKWALESGYDDTLSIDRIDPYGDYCPNNCRWADSITQANNKTTTRKVTVCVTEYTLFEACKKYGIGKWLFYQRIKKGMSEEEAFLTPKKGGK